MTRVTGDPFRGQKVKGQGHQAALGGCSSREWKSVVSRKLAGRKSMTRVTGETHLEAERSKVKVTRLLWVAVQVTSCRGGGILCRSHHRPQSLLNDNIHTC